jgi:hypothetical protein
LTTKNLSNRHSLAFPSAKNPFYREIIRFFSNMPTFSYNPFAQVNDLISQERGTKLPSLSTTKNRRNPIKWIARRLQRFIKTNRKFGGRSVDRFDVNDNLWLARDSGCELSDDASYMPFAPRMSKTSDMGSADSFKPSLEEKRILATLILAHRRRVRSLIENIGRENVTGKFDSVTERDTLFLDFLFTCGVPRSEKDVELACQAWLRDETDLTVFSKMVVI